MDIENLTKKEAREIESLFQSSTLKSNLLKQYIGKYVIVRSRNEGVNAGTVKDLDSTGIILSDARRLWYHDVEGSESWYEGVATNGLSKYSKVSVEIEKAIVEDYSITVCSDKAKESIKKHSDYKV